MTSEAGGDHPLIRGRTGRGVGVAVIDSGVNPWHPHVRGVAGGVGIDVRGREVEESVDALGHGTAVAAAIRECAPDAEIHAVRVFEERLSTTGAALAAALRWCGARGLQVVNLSLGTVNPEHRDALAAAAATVHGFIVSVAPDAENEWLPGGLPGVVGVVPDPTLPRGTVRWEEGASASVAFASPVPRPLPGIPPEHNLRGPSFAVAYVSAWLARMLEGRPDLRDDPDVLAVIRHSP